MSLQSSPASPIVDDTVSLGSQDTWSYVDLPSPAIQPARSPTPPPRQQQTRFRINQKSFLITYPQCQLDKEVVKDFSLELALTNT